jgi:hypothetical protein
MIGSRGGEGTIDPFPPLAASEQNDGGAPLSAPFAAGGAERAAEEVGASLGARRYVAEGLWVGAGSQIIAGSGVRGFERSRAMLALEFLFSEGRPPPPPQNGKRNENHKNRNRPASVKNFHRKTKTTESFTLTGCLS